MLVLLAISASRCAAKFAVRGPRFLVSAYPPVVTIDVVAGAAVGLGVCAEASVVVHSSVVAGRRWAATWTSSSCEAVGADEGRVVTGGPGERDELAVGGVARQGCDVAGVAVDEDVGDGVVAEHAEASDSEHRRVLLNGHEPDRLRPVRPLGVGRLRVGVVDESCLDMAADSHLGHGDGCCSEVDGGADAVW